MDKKKIIILVIALLAIGAIVYMTFFHNKVVNTSPGNNTKVDAGGNLVTVAPADDPNNTKAKDAKMGGLTY